MHLDYAAGDQPVMAVKLQDMFGQKQNPTVAGGKVKVLLHLLSPAGRPLAVTSDLASFWANAYADVRKQMRARYPKHKWPEDSGVIYCCEIDICSATRPVALRLPYCVCNRLLAYFRSFAL